jgi:hypothetical protein
MAPRAQYVRLIKALERFYRIVREVNPCNHLFATGGMVRILPSAAKGSFLRERDARALKRSKASATTRGRDARPRSSATTVVGDTACVRCWHARTLERSTRASVVSSSAMAQPNRSALNHPAPDCVVRARDGARFTLATQRVASRSALMMFVIGLLISGCACGASAVASETSVPPAAQNAALADYEVIPVMQSTENIQGQLHARYVAWRVDRKRKTVQQCSMDLRYDRDDVNPKPACVSPISAAGVENMAAATVQTWVLGAAPGLWLIDATTGKLTFCSHAYGPARPGCYRE